MAGTWIRATYQFGEPAALLTLGERECHLHREIVEAIGLRHVPENPTADEVLMLARLMEEWIGRLRPNLAGGALLAMTFNLMPRSWEFYYTHPSLPRIPFGKLLDKMPLIPEPDAPSVV